MCTVAALAVASSIARAPSSSAALLPEDARRVSIPAAAERPLKTP